MGINWSSAYEAGQASKTAAAAAPVATTAAAAAPATTTKASNIVSDVTSAIESGVEELFDNLVGVSNSRTSFGSSTIASGTVGDSYMGNYGTPYGANIIKVDSTAGYDFTATFTNTQSKSITVNIWNKVGPDFLPLSGSALAPKNTTLTFALAAGSSQVVAFQENSQVAWAQACSETAESGAYATTWGEANFVATGSGYDVSAIMNSSNDYDMSISSSEAPACTSDRTQNFWLTATDPVGNSDGSCYIAQSTATLKVEMGGTI